MKDRLAFYSLKLLSLLSLNSLRFLASVIGIVLWCLRTREARTTTTNLALCFPQLTPWERAKLACASLQESTKTLFEATLIWKKDWPWLRNKIFAIEGIEIFENQLAEQKGLIVILPHLGNWELAGPFLNSIAPLTCLYQPLKTSLANEIMLNGRQKNSLHLAPTNLKGVAQLLRVLRSGGAIGILPDQVPERNTGGEIGNFFGHPALTMTLIHSLIQKTNCLVCCCYAERIENGFNIIITHADQNIYSHDAQTSVTALNNSITQCVLRAPSQYQWEYKRFRRLPADCFVDYS